MKILGPKISSTFYAIIIQPPRHGEIGKLTWFFEIDLILKILVHRGVFSSDSLLAVNDYIYSMKKTNTTLNKFRLRNESNKGREKPNEKKITSIFEHKTKYIQYIYTDKNITYSTKSLNWSFYECLLSGEIKIFFNFQHMRHLFTWNGQRKKIQFSNIISL